MKKDNIYRLNIATLVLFKYNKIVGGYECPKNSVPYQVSLFTGYNFCGGVLISDEWVLSAAHCKPNSNLEIRLGEHDIWEPDGTDQHIMSAEFIRHPDYDSRTQDSDIMLIKLSRPAALNSYVRPAVLPSRCARSQDGGIFVPAMRAVTRYPDTLQCLEVPLLSDDTCFNAYPFQITENMICAGYLEGGKDSCQLQGVVSWGARLCTEEQAGVHTKVCNYVSWIKNTMASG
uniref:trypsin n=1 Tax=Oreochromis aureus TaxID=47969 RepID=A0A668VU91_OREAU